MEKDDDSQNERREKRIKTGVPGFDDLIVGGFEGGSVVLLSGGAGTGKTNLSCQFLYNGAKSKRRGLYITFEEDAEQIKNHMKNFGMDFYDFESRGHIKFLKVDIYYISQQMTRIVEAGLLKQRGRLLVELEDIPPILPKDFKADIIVIDSLSALASALKRENYRYFIFHLFTQLKKSGAVTFAITEFQQDPNIQGRTKIEEFLADGVVRLYNLKHGDSRIRALEVLKLRGTKHEEKIVPFNITDRGIIVYPNQSVLTALGE